VNVVSIAKGTPTPASTRVLFARRTAFGALGLFFLGLLHGCAIEYRHAPFWGAGGYTDHELSRNVFRVSYLSGRTGTPSLLEVFALYRCAELARERGFERFAVLDRRAQGANLVNSTWASLAYTIELLEADSEKYGGKPIPVHNARDVLSRYRARVKPDA